MNIPDTTDLLEAVILDIKHGKDNHKMNFIEKNNLGILDKGVDYLNLAINYINAFDSLRKDKNDNKKQNNSNK